MNRHSIVKTQGVHHSTYNIWLKVFYDMSFNSRGHVLAKGLKYTRPSIAVDVLTSSEELITLQRLLGVFIQKCLPPITMWCYTHAHCTVCDNYSWLELFLFWSVRILFWHECLMFTHWGNCQNPKARKTQPQIYQYSMYRYWGTR